MCRVIICADAYVNGVTFESSGNYMDTGVDYFCILISELFVFAFLSFLLSGFIGRLACFSIVFKDMEDAARAVSLLSHEGADNFVQSVRFFRIMSDCTVILVKAVPAFCRSTEIDRRYEGCDGWYLYNAATKEISSVSLRSIHGQK